MQLIHADRAGGSRVRFVFNEAVVSFSRAGDVTFGEVARTLGELSSQRYGDPVAIDVTLGSRNGDPALRMLCGTSPDPTRLAPAAE
jgi:hypothetical protein